MTEHTENTEQPVTFEELTETHKILTKEVLEGEDGYVVLDTLFVQLTQQVYMTSHFTMPIMTNMSKLEQKLTDPEGFKASFNTFINDIREFQRKLMATHQLHKGKTGGANPKDYPVLYSISEKYNELMNEYDKVIHPLHLSLFGIIEEEAPELLSIDKEEKTDDE